MESRFRVRFWPRRVRTAPAELDLHSVPYQNASDGQKQPVFIHQPLGRNLSERRKKDDALALRGLAYRTSRAGRPPVIGERPHPGNGPVKLNATRRLSSGELSITTQDQAHILENIRDGEYVVASNKRHSRSASVKSPAPGDRRGSHSSVNASPPQKYPPTSTPASWAPFHGSSPLLDIPENAAPYASVRTSSGLVCNSTSNLPDVFGRPTSTQSSPMTDGLGISDLQPMSPGILKKTSSHISLTEPPTEQNATIRALWKAEYKQLVAMYGQSGVNKNLGDGPWEQKRLSTIADVPPGGEKPIPFALVPLPRPSFEHREITAQPGTSRLSKNESSLQDDTSDEASQQRLSFISSAGYASSYTTRASVGDSDSINTKEDIRKLVESMRSTYIQAIEAREPSLQAVKAMKKKKKKTRTSNTPQSTPKVSSGPTTPESERTSVMPASSSPSLRSQRSTRVPSLPVATISTLPAIQASPTRERVPDLGLKRADSSTLGALMGETKRAGIRKRTSERHSRHGSQSTKPQRSSSSVRTTALKDNANVSAEDAEPLDEEFASLYRDIFQGSSHEFWQSSPTLESTIALSSTLELPPPSDISSSDSSTPTQAVPAAS
ncbi:uncharacterized protein HMPREF1541_02079 [Cyphellophora europaea CBS 101466]|uniref:Uncharacterized protein n=1 Tax=Cyphellophora europaea (strain CBS 101466) TaxID=1220924 RepID=W2S2J6_CYPE1|nr:uncharacterized protein HMPREF1541_02079 [Cyphellophora europaea CBS 101466]ETN42921.1 hypothetical protein HMPREF1541_02079 [Cyphellophora europaea CBS 101466]